jgi:hypothetical protein
VNDANGEAMRISRRIFSDVNADAARKGRKFAVLALPDPVLVADAKAGRGAADLRAWDARLSALRADGTEVLDLLPAMRALPDETLDRGYDGTHYGPKANAALAGIVADALAKAGVLAR